MPRTATFYTHVADGEAFVLRLIRTVYDRGTRLLILCAHEDGMARLSDALWAHEDNSFLAHDIVQAGQTSSAPLLLSLSLPEHAPGTVLNLGAALCDAPHITRVLEIVTADEAALAAARIRFAAYRRAGFVLEHHDRRGK